jgi:DNA-binding response OmpR family regulator
VTEHRVLIVDDNLEYAETMAAALAKRGFATTVAFDAHTALELVETVQPQSMLIDIALPDMSGWSLARLLGARPRAPRMIAVSALGQAIHCTRSTAAGFKRHIVKPAKLAEVVAALREPHVA